MEDSVLFYDFHDDIVATAKQRCHQLGISSDKAEKWHRKYGFLFAWHKHYDKYRYNVNRQFVYFPLIIAMCDSEKAVSVALKIAVKYKLTPAIRGGAHCMEPFSLSNDIIIDQSQRTGIKVKSSTVTVEPGVLLGRLIFRLNAQQKIMPVGSCPNVCISGLALGGGVGFYGRTYGATCDNLKSATVLLADGQVVKASENVHQDLFWALRGAGGGNFGIVLQMTFHVHSVKKFYLYKFSYPLDDLPEILPIWQKWAVEGPDSLGSEFRFNNGGQRPGISGVFFGHKAELLQLLSVFPSKHQQDYSVEKVDFADAGREFAGKGRWPPFTKAKNSFIDQYLPKEAMHIIVKYMRQGGGLSVFELNALGGKFNQVKPRDTAFVHRRSKMWLLINAHWQTQEDGSSELKWLRNFFAELTPFTNGMVYQNMVDLELSSPLERYYGENIERLRRVKRTYDPKGLFSFAQDVSK